ncbi:MAG: hypothetical protein KBT87_05290 [Gammaproteobacteria bacterium]|nr:hypothetical protein [Gammaproteobacteria bacterium]MBQ0774069.1 hypothetical protein [Gammaproteobacteria bacterium]
MAKITKLNPLAAAVGVAFMASAFSAPVTAAENPFATSDLGAGYQVAGDMEGKCGEGKCGADKKAEGKCGEGKCGADKKSEGKCGADKKGEGKCGEGKCGADKKG